MKIASTKILGVLHKDDNGLYVGMKVDIRHEGKKIPMASVFAVTLIRTLFIRIQINTPLGDDKPYKVLLRKTRAAVASMIAANPER